MEKHLLYSFQVGQTAKPETSIGWWGSAPLIPAPARIYSRIAVQRLQDSRMPEHMQHVEIPEDWDFLEIYDPNKDLTKVLDEIVWNMFATQPRLPDKILPAAITDYPLQGWDGLTPENVEFNIPDYLPHIEKVPIRKLNRLPFRGRGLEMVQGFAKRNFPEQGYVTVCRHPLEDYDVKRATRYLHGDTSRG